MNFTVNLKKNMTLSRIISLAQRMGNEPQYPEQSLVLTTLASPWQFSLNLVSQVHGLPTAEEKYIQEKIHCSCGFSVGNLTQL